MGTLDVYYNKGIVKKYYPSVRIYFFFIQTTNYWSYFKYKVEIGLAGSMAGSVMAFLNCPIELLKVKLQTQDPKGVIGVNGKLEPPVRHKQQVDF